MAQAQRSVTSNISSVDFLAEPLGTQELGDLNIVTVGDETAVEGLRAGTVMGKITASGKYVPYNDAGTDGEEDAVGILTQDISVNDMFVVDTAGVKTKKEKAATLFTKGSMFEAKLTGVDAAAKVDLADITFV